MTNQSIIISFFIIIIGIFYLARIREGHNWGDDFAMYIHHAKNICQGIAYYNTGLILNPSISILPRTYPPIFPLLLALVYMWFGLNFVAMKVEIIIFFILSLFMIYLTFKDEIRFPYPVLLVAVIAFNYYFLNFLDNILSEIPFIFFLYLNLFYIKKYYSSIVYAKQKNLYAFLFALMIYLSYGTRSIGILLMPSLLIYDVIKFRKITKFTVQVSILFTFLVIIQNLFIHNDITNLKTFSLQMRDIIFNIINYSQSLFFFWFNGYSRILHRLLFSIISCLAVIGYIKKIKNKITILEIFFMLYMVSLMILPGVDPIRYIMSIIPLYLFYALLAIQNLKFYHLAFVKNFIFFILTVAILANYIGAYNTKMEYGSPGENVTKKESLELFDYINKETDKEDVFIFQKPRVLSLFTERKSSLYHMPKDDKALWRYFHQIKAKYIIIGKIFRNDQIFLIPFVKRYEDYFQETYSNTDFTVYRIKRIKIWDGS